MSAAIPAPALPLRQGTAGADPVVIPQLGFGTYKVGDADAERAVSQALEAGYRHIDTAQMYGNEAGVGRALAASGIPREQLWVTSKLNNPNHRRDDALRSFDATLRDLQLEVLDLFLVHWPLANSPGIDLVDTWRTMIEILRSGRVRAIGVSNYQAEHLRTIIDATGVVPAINQIELHPYLIQRELRNVHEELGIVTESWSPLGRGRLLEDPELVRVAAELGVTPAQVIVRWHLQHGLVVIPKTTHAVRMRENADVFSFALSPEQMAAVDALDRGMRTGSHPDQVQV
ncbi:aldo/keto reductase [Actinomyces sp. 594]|uniref:aldo/keto reductase n=1 Tax=Actinomyces sp. 594 TaxID=2057793 RepID=UPI001C56D1E8|nr:aldo/keto reductase [Actinomyces sp. 594]MBW3069812.1 aldo/keto reductase [Actinomyces sp. 594]